MKVWIKVFTPLLLIILVVMLAWRWGEPQITKWIVNQSKQELKAQGNLDLSIDNIQIGFIPPKVTVSGLLVTPLAGNLEFLAPVKAEQLQISIDFLNLLGGKIKISKILISGLNVEIDLDKYKPSRKPQPLNLSGVFKLLEIFPIAQIVILNPETKLASKRLDLNINLSQLQIVGAYNRKDSVSLSVETPKLMIRQPSKDLGLETSFTGEANLSSKKLEIKKMTIANGEGLKIQGTFTTDKIETLTTSPDFKYSLTSDLKIEDLIFIAKRLLPKAALPAISGHLTGDLNGTYKDKERLNLRTSLRLDNFQIEKYSIGKVELRGTLAKNIFSTEVFTVDNLAGNLDLSGSDLSLIAPFNSHVKVATRSFELKPFFSVIGLPKIPVKLALSGELSCQGPIENLNLGCNGNLDGKHLEVKTGETPIVELEAFNAKGTFSVTKEQVEYQADLQLGTGQVKSVGKSQGKISYTSGFNIGYSSPFLDTQDIKSLSGLNLGGGARLEGVTYGTSSFGEFEMTLDGKDFFFERYHLGNIKTEMHYAKGNLEFKKVDGQVGKSRYYGELKLDLKDTILSGKISAPQFELEDLKGSLKQVVSIPFELRGSGIAEIEFTGPLQLGQMSYRLTSLVRRGTLFTENFDELSLGLNSIAGQVSISNTYLRKNKSTLSILGKADPVGTIDIKADGSNYRMEDIDILNRYGQNLTGKLNLIGKFHNKILDPHFRIEGKISDTVLADSDLPNSYFEVNLDEIEWTGNGNFFGGKVNTEFQLPRSPNGNLRLIAQAKQWDFVNFVSTFFNSPLKGEYKSLISLDMQINGPKENLANFNGNLNVSQLQMSRGALFVRQSRPLAVNISNGKIHFPKYEIIGTGANLNLAETDFSLDHLNLKGEVSADLRLLHVFAPFLDNFGGEAKGQLQISGDLFDPEFFGQLDLVDGLVKLKGLPHTFERLSSRVNISQTRLEISALRGLFANGIVRAEGHVEFAGYKQVRVLIRAQGSDLKLNIPDKVKTGGQAEVVLSGNWFPYSLTGTYRVQQGLMEKEFTENTGTSSTYKYSSYLPKQILELNFSPILLDIQVLLEKSLEVKNSMMLGHLSGQLQVKGPPDNPLLFGNIKLDQNTQLLFRDKSFDVQSGTIKFTNPSEINPELYITARSRVQTFDISLLLQGTAKNPQLLLSSQPPLPEPDIISLLALGMTTESLDTKVDSSQQAAQTGYQLGLAIISSNPLNKEIKKSLGVDVKFSPGFDTKNVAVPRVTVSKDLTKKINASATSSFSDEQTYDVRLQYLFNEKLSAVGTYERSEAPEGGGVTTGAGSQQEVLGLDLEYKVEFK